MKETRDARQRITPEEARTVLGLYADVRASTDELAADLRLIVEQNLELGRKTEHLREQGLQPSPVWELGDLEAGSVPPIAARLAVLPSVFRTRYFEAEGLAVLEDAASMDLVVEAFDTIASDPVGALVALESTLRAWLDDTAPTRALPVRSKPQLRLLSLLVADIARKGAAGLDDLEWLSSIGLDAEDFREDDSPPITVIRAASESKLRAMFAEERAWIRKAFGR